MADGIDRVVVLGAGAVGGSVGGLLAHTGVPTLFIARGRHGDAIERDGLLVRTPGQDVRVRAPVVATPAQVEWQAGDLVLLATTLHDALPALGDLRASAGARVPVACFTNGVHAERWAATHVDTVLSTLVWVAAAHLAPGVVQLYSRGPHGVLDTGGDRALAVALSGLLHDAGFDARWRRDIGPWKAAAWVTDLGGAAQALVDGDWHEVVAVARREGERVLATARVERVPMQVLMARVAHVRVEQVDGRVRGGGSTWQSVQRGRPTETAWIEGAMAALAHSVGMAAPVNRLLATMAEDRRRLPAEEVLRVASPLDRDSTMR